MEFSVKTATGKEFEVRFAASTTAGITQLLYIEFIGSSMMDIVSVFSNPDETNYIEGFAEGELNKQWKNYTNLIEAIVLAESGNVRIALAAPVDVLGE